MDAARNGGPTLDEVQEQLKRILASEMFEKAPLPSTLLTYLVDSTMDGTEVKAEVILEETFPKQYRAASELVSKQYLGGSKIVRVVATDLRKRLARYYEAFTHETVIISVPRAGSGHSYRVDCVYQRNLKALDHYRRGLYYMTRSGPESLGNANAAFMQAISEDISYVPAHECVTETFFLIVLSAAITDDWRSRALFAFPGRHKPQLGWLTIDRARSHAEATLYYRPSSWRAHLILGAIHASKFNWESAAKEFELANIFDPENAGNHPFYAAYLLATGRRDEAVEIVRRRALQDTSDLTARGIYELFLYASGANQPGSHHYEKRREDSRWADEGGPFNRLHRELTDIQAKHVVRYGGYRCFNVQGLYDNGVQNSRFLLYGLRTLGQARLRSPESFFDRGTMRERLQNRPSISKGRVLRNRHPLTKALEQLREVIEWDYDNPHPLQIALAYLALAEMKLHQGIPCHWYNSLPRRYPPLSEVDGCPIGATDVRKYLRVAISALGHACEENDPVMVWLHLLPIFDPLRHEAGFKKLIKRMNLP